MENTASISSSSGTKPSKTVARSLSKYRYNDSVLDSDSDHHCLYYDGEEEEEEAFLDDGSEDYSNNNGDGFMPVFSRERTASMLALRGFDMNSDDADENGNENQDGGSSQTRFAASSDGVSGIQIRPVASKVSGECAVSPSDTSTIAPLDFRFDDGNLISRIGSTNYHQHRRRQDDDGDDEESSEQYYLQRMPVAPSVPKDATVLWLRKHGFVLPWDPLFIAHWTMVFVTIAWFYSALGLYMYYSNTTNLRWVMLLSILLPLAIVAVMLDVAIALCDVEAAEAKHVVSPDEGAETPSRVQRRNIYYKFERGIPAVDPITSMCRLCNVATNPGTRHCKVCNKCVGGYDHHCRWLNTCIGDRNYRLFFAFMMVSLLHNVIVCGCVLYTAYYIGVDITGLEKFIESTGVVDAVKVLFIAMLVVFAVVVVASVLGIGLLLGFHIQLWWYSMRTVDYLARPRHSRRNTSWLRTNQRYQTVGGGASRDVHTPRAYSPSISSVLSGHNSIASTTDNAIIEHTGMGCLPVERVSLIVGSGESVMSPASPK